MLAAYRKWQLSASGRYDESGFLARTPLEIIMGREVANNSWVINNDAGQIVGNEITARRVFRNAIKKSRGGFDPRKGVLGFFIDLVSSIGKVEDGIGAIIDELFGGKHEFKFRSHDTSDRNDAEVAQDFSKGIMKGGQDIT